MALRRSLEITVFALIVLLCAACGSDTTAGHGATSPDGSVSRADSSTGSGGSGTGGATHRDASTGAGGTAPETDASGNGGSGGSTPDVDAGGAPEAGADAASTGPACGKPPFITETVTISELYVPGPLADVTIAVEPCGVSVKTDASGQASFSYPAGLPHYYRVSAAGFITSFWPERSPITTDATTALYVLGTTFENARLPDYDAAKSEILVLMGVVPPQTNDGVTITATDAPGAKVTNWLAQTDQMTSATVKNGYTTVTNLPASGFVTLTAVKPGHVVVMNNVTFTATARFPVETGAVTYVDAYVAQ